MNYNFIKKKLQLQLQKKPNDYIIISKLASVMLEIRDRENALKLFKKATEIEQNVQTLNNLAYFYLNIGEPSKGRWFYRVDKAIEILEKVIKLDPPSHFPYSMLGEAYLKGQEYFKAEEILRVAVSKKATLPNSNNLGVALYNQNKYKEAAENFLEAHKLRVENEYSYYSYLNYGVCLAKMLKHKEALLVAELLTQLYNGGNSGEVDGIDIAKIYYLCDKFNNVVDNFSKLSNVYIINPNDFNIYAYSLYVLGKKNRLKEIYENRIQENKEYLNEITNDYSIDDGNKRIRIRQLTEEISRFNEIYNNINLSIRPTLKFKPFIEYDCYIFGCIRHNNPFDWK